MRKKVYATLREDLMSQMEEYDRSVKEKSEKVHRDADRWASAQNNQADTIKNKVLAKLGAAEGEDIRVSVDTNWSGAHQTWRVHVTRNDRSKFDEDKALAWNVDISLDKDGNVKKESGSWSGLKAVTPDQISDLKRSVQMLETIQRIDWESILTSPVARYSDYVSDDETTELRNLEKNRPNFEKQIAQEELRDLVGTNTWVKLKSSPTSYVSDRRGGFWAKILKETPSRYSIALLPVYYADDIHFKKDTYPEYNANKSKFIDCLVIPIETKEV